MARKQPNQIPMHHHSTERSRRFGPGLWLALLGAGLLMSGAKAISVLLPFINNQLF